MTLNQLLPLGAFILNVILVTLALVRNGGSRLNRVFAYCVGSMAIWNFGAFLLRRAPDERADRPNTDFCSAKCYPAARSCDTRQSNRGANDPG